MALKYMKQGKAFGLDEIPIQMLSALEGQSPVWIHNTEALKVKEVLNTNKISM